MTWPTFVRRMEGARRRRQYESIRPDRGSPLQWFLGEGRPKVLLILTKRYLVENWLSLGALDDEVAVGVRYGLPNQLAIDMVAHFVRQWRLSVYFIGDLDPMDLTVFEAYRRGDAKLRRRRSNSIPITYLGIDDGWLSLCERELKPGFMLQNLLIKMPDIERDHLEAVETLVPDLAALAGDRAATVLRDGWKLEVEGASNPALYRRGFPKRLANYIRKRMHSNS